MDYRPVTWNTGDTVSMDKLVALTNNQDWLKDHTPTLRYAYGTPVDTKTKQLTGRFVVSARKTRTFTQLVSFGDFFSSGCSPTVVASVISSKEDIINLNIYGRGRISPSSTECYIHGYANTHSGAKKSIEQSFYVDWIATGY